MDIKDAKIVIQGFGNAGSFLAKFLYDLGAKVVGISDAYEPYMTLMDLI